MINSIAKLLSSVLLVTFIFISFFSCNAMKTDDLDQHRLARHKDITEKVEFISSPHLKLLHNIAAKEETLKKTNTYFYLSSSHSILSLFYNSEDSLYRCLTTGIAYFNYHITAYLPEKNRFFVHESLKMVIEQLEILRCCQHTKQYVMEQILGFVSLFLMEILPPAHAVNPYREEIEASIYYFFKAVGWYGADASDLYGGTNHSVECNQTETPEIAANSKVISDLTGCHWDSNRAAIIDKDCITKVFNTMPHYANLTKWNEWYSDIQYIPDGRMKHIFTAVTKHNRKNIPSNTKILLIGQEFKYESSALDLTMYCRRCEILNKFDKPVISYYPEFLGAYLGDFFPFDLLPFDIREALRNNQTVPMARTDKEGKKDFGKGYFPSEYKKIKMIYTEMEYFNDKIETYFYKRHTPLSDHIVFEYELANWVAQKIVKCRQGDNRESHDLLVNRSYYRAYHIGNNIYLINPGLMPKMIDLDQLSYIWESDRKYQAWLHPDEVQSDEAKKVVSEMWERGIFTVFSEHFSQYKISDHNTIPTDAEVRHYYIPDEYLKDM